jgi:hypothetical protein
LPDIPNRAELEAELARRFSKLSAAHRRELLSLLGNPPSIGNVPAAFWEKVAAELNGSFVPFLAQIFLDSAERILPDLPIGVDWGLVNERAANWARQYSYELIRNITNTSRRATQEAVAAFFERGQTRGDLEAALTRLFGPTRASMIAVTEVTRAASNGEREIARELAAEGVEMIPIWQTNNDELVCPICGPRHGKQITDNAYPPAHVNCRCWVNHELPKVER